MKVIILIGIILIIFGAFGLVQGAFHYTTQEKVLDIGPIEATATKNKTVPISPLLGAASFVGGILMVLAGNNKVKKV